MSYITEGNVDSRSAFHTIDLAANFDHVQISRREDGSYRALTPTAMDADVRDTDVLFSFVQMKRSMLDDRDGKKIFVTKDTDPLVVHSGTEGYLRDPANADGHLLITYFRPERIKSIFRCRRYQHEQKLDSNGDAARLGYPELYYWQMKMAVGEENVCRYLPKRRFDRTMRYSPNSKCFESLLDILHESNNKSDNFLLAPTMAAIQSKRDISTECLASVLQHFTTGSGTMEELRNLHRKHRGSVMWRITEEFVSSHGVTRQICLEKLKLLVQYEFLPNIKGYYYTSKRWVWKSPKEIILSLGRKYLREQPVADRWMIEEAKKIMSTFNDDDGSWYLE